MHFKAIAATGSAALLLTTGAVCAATGFSVHEEETSASMWINFSRMDGANYVYSFILDNTSVDDGVLSGFQLNIGQADAGVVSESSPVFDLTAGNTSGFEYPFNFCFGNDASNDCQGSNSNGDLQAGNTDDFTITFSTSSALNFLGVGFRFQHTGGDGLGIKTLYDGELPPDGVTPVPLPATGWLLLAGLGGLPLLRRKRHG